MAVVGITGFTPQVGRTTLAVQLAKAYASQGRRVLVVDLDGDGESGFELGIDRVPLGWMPGVTDVMVGGLPPEECVIHTSISDVDWLGPGEGLDDVDQDFEPRWWELPKAAKEMVRELENGYDVILHDTPAEAAAPSTFLTVAVSDTLLTLARQGTYGLVATPMEINDVKTIRGEINPKLHFAGTVLTSQGEAGLRRAVSDALNKLRPFVGSN